MSDMRILKFETLVKDINKAISNSENIFGYVRWSAEVIGGAIGNRVKSNKNLSLFFIYEIEKVNEYAKVILENATISWENNYTIVSLKDPRNKLAISREFIKYCRAEDSGYEKYKFLFWALMLLAVDNNEKEEKLSLICDFARMLKIHDDEMMDIIRVIKYVFHEEDNHEEFRTSIIPECFHDVLNLYE